MTAMVLALGAVAACAPRQPDASGGPLASVADLDRGGPIYSQIAPNARDDQDGARRNPLTIVAPVAPASEAAPRVPLLSGAGVDLPP